MFFCIYNITFQELWSTYSSSLSIYMQSKLFSFYSKNIFECQQPAHSDYTYPLDDWILCDRSKNDAVQLTSKSRKRTEKIHIAAQ